MATYILIAIDGTDSKEWLDEFGSNSYVYRFYADFQTDKQNKMWQHGVDLLGGNVTQVMDNVKQALSIRIKELVPEIKDLADWALICDGHSQAVKTVFESTDIEFCLVGHSRGAAMVADLAAQLPKPVKFLGLYDSVARATGIKGGVIRNVKLTYHARRHPDMSSRTSFGYANITVPNERNSVNGGNVLTTDGTYCWAFFRTSHGGIGGDYVASPTNKSLDYSGSTTYEKDPTKCFAVLNCNNNLNESWGKRNPAAARARYEQFLSESQKANDFIRRGAKLAGLPLN